MRGSGLVLTILAIAGALSTGGALAPRDVAAQEARVSIDQVVTSEGGDEAVAYVSALDASGRPVQDVTDLTASVDGLRVDQASVAVEASADAGIAIVLGIDVSGSMTGEPLAGAREAATSFVGQLLANDAVAVATFASAPPATVDFAADRDSALAIIAGLEADAGNGTALYDAVAAMIAGSRDAPLQRRAIVLLTDGNDTGDRSTTSRDEVLRLAESAGVPFYAVGLGGSADDVFLRDLAAASSGRHFTAGGAADIQAIFDAIATTLRGQLVVAFRLPAPAEGERTLALSLRIEDALYTAETTFQDGRPAAETASPDGRSLSPTLVLGVGGAIAALVIVALAIARLGRRRPRSPIAGGPGADPSLPAVERSPRPSGPRAAGRLVVVSGPNQGASASLDGGPVTIGAQAGSTLRLEASDGHVAPLHARAWLQGSRLMLHHVAGTGQTVVGDQAVEWATVEPGETLRVGSDVIAFQLHLDGLIGSFQSDMEPSPLPPHGA